MLKKRKAIFLDRDGVIVRSNVIDGKPFAPICLKEFKLLPYASKCIDLFKKENYLTIIISNQPDVSKGIISNETLNKMNEILFFKTKVDDIYICTHTDSDNCKCRKPKNGLIIKAAKKYNINLNKSYMIGDRKKDIDAGILSNCKTIFIDRNYIEQKPKNFDYKVSSLQKAFFYILNDSK